MSNERVQGVETTSQLVESQGKTQLLFDCFVFMAVLPVLASP